MRKKHFLLLLAFIGASPLARASTADLDSLYAQARRMGKRNLDSTEILSSLLLKQSLAEGNFEFAAKGAFFIGSVNDIRNMVLIAGVRYREALQYLRRANVDEMDLELSILISLGRVNNLAGRISEGMDNYYQALRLCGDCRLKSLILYSIGYRLYTTQSYDSAIVRLSNAYKLALNQKNFMRAVSCLNYIGLCHHYLGDYSKAREYYQEILNSEVLIGEEYKESAGWALHNTAFSYFDEGLHDQALDYYLQALQVKQQLADSSQQFRTLMDLGELMMVKADTQQAVRYLEQAAALFHLKIPDAESFKVFELLDRATFSTDPEKNRLYLQRVMDEWGAQAAQLAAETERQQSQALEGFTRYTEKETSRLTAYWIASLVAAVVIALLSFYFYKRRQKRKHREILKLISEV